MHGGAQKVRTWGVKGGLKEAAGRVAASREVGTIGKLQKGWLRERGVECIAERVVKK
jgi:hypothetical protein